MKLSYVTRVVPLSAMATVAPLDRKPCLSDLVVAEVVEVRRHTSIETREGTRLRIFPGDVIVGAFGTCYATNQYEGYIPAAEVDTCDILSIGGVLGEVRCKSSGVRPPTRVRILGSVRDAKGRALALQQFGVRPGPEPRQARDAVRPRVILSVGASVSSGKTTTAGTLARALSRGGYRVAATKITGTAAGRDARFFAANGADPVLDFTDAGYPSTYMLELDQLLWIWRALISHLRAAQPDYVVVELAEGIFQRETRMLLESPAFRKHVDHVFFNAADSLSAAQGAHLMAEYGLPLRAIAGTITKSPLMMREAAEATGLRCLSTARLLAGVLAAVGGRTRTPSGAAFEHAGLGQSIRLAQVAEAGSRHRSHRHDTNLHVVSDTVPSPTDSREDTVSDARLAGVALGRSLARRASRLNSIQIPRVR